MIFIMILALYSWEGKTNNIKTIIIKKQSTLQSCKFFSYLPNCTSMWIVILTMVHQSEEDAICLPLPWTSTSFTTLFIASSCPSTFVTTKKKKETMPSLAIPILWKITQFSLSLFCTFYIGLNLQIHWHTFLSIESKWEHLATPLEC